VIPLSSLYRALFEGKEIEPHTVVITIDDGYADRREVAFPILKNTTWSASGTSRHLRSRPRRRSPHASGLMANT
jgi:hypothetical protein